MEETLLSHGQLQLFCLARTLLKQSSVLILDEPTSRYVAVMVLCGSSLIIPSVDTQTDARMQAIINSEFKHCTVIMVAHRLDSLLDYDLVAVMDKGQLVESGNPRALLSDQSSIFSSMYHAGSGEEEDTLT